MTLSRVAQGSVPPFLYICASIKSKTIAMKESEILAAISQRMGITQLNEMQIAMSKKCASHKQVILLSPTGSGKTLAFVIPLLKTIDEALHDLQAIIIAPSRELVIQIQNCIHDISAARIRSVACYGGHDFALEARALEVTPQIIVSTPGRLLDHMNRRSVNISLARTLVLDEFDKALELGFHDEMKRIIGHLKHINRRILTSATNADSLPDFVAMDNPVTVNFLYQNEQLKSRISVTHVQSDEKDKLATLLKLLNTIIDDNLHKTIIFVNYRDAVQRIAQFLRDHHLPVGFYHGALEQFERETALTMFTNESQQILVSTDLAARGLDIPEVTNIIHYHLPQKEDIYTHRNGRSARVDAEGNVFVITSPQEQLPEFIKADNALSTSQLTQESATTFKPKFATLRFAAGKKEKISRADILGFLIANAGLTSQEIGKITVADHYALVAVAAHKAKIALSAIATAKIKGKRVKTSLLSLFPAISDTGK